MISRTAGSKRFFQSLQKTLIPPVVSCEWLNENIQRANIQIVDASWHMPAAKRNGSKEFSEQRIPGATFFDLDAVSDQNSSLPHMMPPADEFSVHMSQIGLNRHDVIVVYDTIGCFSAPRAWYMFKATGALNVAVLDGGLPMWRKHGFEIERGQMTGAYRKPRSNYEGRLEKSSFADLDQVRMAIQDDEILVVDARGKPRFDGTAPDPRASIGVRAGHMPNSYNVPYNAILNEDQTFKSPKEIRTVFSTAGVDLEKPIITTCGSGVTACILSLGMHLVHVAEGSEGHRLQVYDGSWSEWGGHSSTPVETST